EPAKRIDWRRSARDHHLYVREREWEASQTVWLWPDLSPSMNFCSTLSETSKIDRALVLMLALADLLARGGERVGMPGLVSPRIGRDVPERFADALVRTNMQTEWPQTGQISRFSDVMVISDFLAPATEITGRIRSLAGSGAKATLLQIFDPAEETFPYEGRLEFADPESGDTWLAERAGSLRQAYGDRLATHRNAISRASRRAGFNFGVHHTDRPATDALLFLYASLSETAPGQNYQHQMTPGGVGVAAS
ncbi:MAG: DUF58 domain-containing protein, partial [Alphaproteobacteria bacterium]